MAQSKKLKMEAFGMFETKSLKVLWDMSQATPLWNIFIFKCLKVPLDQLLIGLKLPSYGEICDSSFISIWKARMMCY